MITAIEIENFKAIRDRVRVELKPLTLIFGPNSAGKSTIVQALHYAHEIFERHYISPDHTLLGGDTMDLGGFDNFVHNHDLNLSVHLRFDLRLDESKLPNYDPRLIVEAGEDAARGLDDCSTGWVDVWIVWEPNRRRPEVNYYGVGLDGEEVASIVQHEALRRLLRSTLFELGEHLGEDAFLEQTLLHFNWGHRVFADDGSLAELRQLAQRTVEFLTDDDHLSRLERPPVGSLPSALPEWGKSLSLLLIDGTEFEDEINVISGLTRMIVGPGELVRDRLREFRYLGPLRALPPRNFEPSRVADPARWANGLAAWDLLSQADDKMVLRVNEWLANRLKSGYSVRLKRGSEIPVEGIPADGASLDELQQFLANVRKLPINTRVVLVPEGRPIEVLPHDVGVGISQLLPAVVLALSAKKSLIAIEQPELHLHPALQTELGDLFIESALGENGNTVILETHSEHLILRLLRRIRETAEGKLPPSAPALRPDQVSVIYVEQTERGVKLSPLRIDESGEFIDRWPKGFFEERVDEIL